MQPTPVRIYYAGSDTEVLEERLLVTESRFICNAGAAGLLQAAVVAVDSDEPGNIVYAEVNMCLLPFSSPSVLARTVKWHYQLHVRWVAPIMDMIAGRRSAIKLWA